MRLACDETKGPVCYEINGAHRGGRDHSQLLLDKIQASPAARIPDVVLCDHHGDRSQELARVFDRQGISVTPQNGRAQAKSKATIRVIAIDDVEDVARISAQPVRNPLVEIGILVSAASVERLGGPVIGIGATLTPDAKETSEKASALFNPIAAMVPERQSSRNMSASLVNSVQMKRTRHGMHDRLTDSSLAYLEHGMASHDLFVIDGLTRAVYPLEVLETRRDTRRQDLKNLVAHEVLPQAMPEETRAGVAFYDPRDPWLYMVLGKRSGSRWHPANVIELPARVPEPIVVNLGLEESDRARDLNVTESQVFATD